MGLTYNGATAGTTLANPPVEIDSIIGGKYVYACTAATTDQPGGKLWMYSSTNDIVDLVGLNAVNDGLSLGIRPGDVLIAEHEPEAAVRRLRLPGDGGHDRYLPELEHPELDGGVTATAPGACRSRGFFEESNDGNSSSPRKAGLEGERQRCAGADAGSIRRGRVQAP